MSNTTSTVLAQEYDRLLLDLDGVVYLGPEAVPGAPQHLQRARALGAQLTFVTNNASRTPAVVADHLTSLGVAASVNEVVSAAQAAAGILAAALPAGARVLVAGGPGLAAAVEEAGLTAVARYDEQPVAVVTGYGPDLVWQRIVEAAVEIGKGLWWVAANTDQSFPTDIGTGPGHGALVELLTRFTGVTPTVAGKPQRPLFDEAVRRSGARRPLMVGDRLDTDIEGAHAAGIDSLLVLTGVSGIGDLVAAPAHHRPTHLGHDLSALTEPRAARDDRWHAEVEAGELVVTGSGSANGWLDAAVRCAWRHLDHTGTPVRLARLGDPRAVR